VLRKCADCGHDFALAKDRCPHCARPGLFPNVDMAELDEERKALDRRYRKAVQDARDRGCEDIVRSFEDHAGTSKAVIARPLWETMRLASGDHQVYSTYHQQTEQELQVPDGSGWDPLRRVGEPALFGEYTREIRFGALTLDGTGVESYGECSWVLRDDMIAHRASVFEENALTFMRRHRVQVAKVDKIPAGYRAAWEDRAKLCVAKLAGRINGTTSPQDFGALLVTPGRTSKDDEFVEVHIGGPLTVRAFKRVILNNSKRRRLLVRSLRRDLKRFAVPLEVVS